MDDNIPVVSALAAGVIIDAGTGDEGVLGNSECLYKSENAMDSDVGILPARDEMFDVDATEGIICVSLAALAELCM